jgi:DnaJ-class molecular chaperone
MPRLEQAKVQIRLPDLNAFDPNPFHDQGRKEQEQEQATRTSGAMDRAEALAMFGLEEGATDDQVNEAYKRLMGMLHPDRGGTTYLAQKLNQARDLLRGKKK